jgi:hypothetical protein
MADVVYRQGVVGKTDDLLVVAVTACNFFPVPVMRFLFRGIMHLTYPNSDPHIGTSSPVDSGEAGAPETEIEITPEMIEAGAEVLLNDSFLDLSPSIAGHLAEEVMRRGVSVSRNRSGKGRR